MNGHRLTTLAALLVMVATAATGCDWGNDGSGDPNETLCITDQDCVDGGVCDSDSGECVECLLDAQCPLGKKCDGETNLCVGCLGDGDCPDGAVCDSALHLCVECIDDADCGDGGQCDEEKNVCIECVDDADCAYPDTPCAFAACMSGECVTGSVPDGLPCNDGDPCTMKDMCLEGECVGGDTDPECIPTGCEGAPDGTPCDDGDACTLDDLCVDGECMGGAITPECAEQDLDGDGFTPEEGDCDDDDPLVNPAAPEDCETAADDDCDGEINEGCQEECFSSGCSGEICASEDVGSDCEWKPEYECLKFSVCGNFGEDGGCAWLLTDEYIACLEGMCLPEEICGNGLDDDCDGIVDNGCMTGCESDADCPLGEMCEIYCGNGWCEGVCVPIEPPNLCEEEGGKCFPLWDEAGEWGMCPDGWGEVDLPGCGDEAICCLDEGPVECWDDSDCPPIPDPDGCTNAYCVNGMCIYEVDPNCGGDCWGDWMCPDGQYCYFEGCAVAETGTCTDQSEFCPEYYSPVCGCDGQTYDNICFLQAAGQSLDYMGACEEPADMDGDGWTVLEGDCDDYNPDVNPGAEELCDDLDNDCDGVIDEGVCGECKDLAGINFGPCAMFMGYGLMNGTCVGISGCGCQGYCDALFNSLDACAEACEEPNLCEAFGGFCSEPSEDGVFYGCPPGSAEVDLPGCGEWSTCCMEEEPPECGGVCECYDLYGDDFSEPCPMMCPTCDNYWACEGGSCVESCGPVPYEVFECLCEDEEICGNNLDDDCDGEVDEGCENPCGGFIGLPCAAGEFCLFPDDTCEWADMMGICQVIPDGCFGLWDPVCGCDGQTYSNECVMWMNLVSKAHDGECVEPIECEDACDCYDLYGDEFSQPCELDCYSCDNYWSCEAGICVESCGPVPEEITECLEEPCGGFAGFTCSDPDNTFCLYPDGTCLWADMLGVCTPYPEFCPLLWQPVCGCDGETYANECSMWVSGVSKDHDGECEQPPECTSDADCQVATDPCIKASCVNGVCLYVEDPDCNSACWSNDMCGEDEFCLFGACAAETGACWPKPQACPFLWDPVCGCDGETYANQCIAWSAGVSVDYEGECEVACVPEGEGFSTMDPWVGGCCPGLSAIVQAEFDPVTGICMMVGNAFVCTYCGNGECGLGENICNCDEDCSDTPGECEALDPYGYGPCDAILGYAWNGDSCTVFSGCDCGQDCDQFYPTWTACMDACAPNSDECTEIDPNAWGDCEMLMGVGFDGEKCVYVSGCGCGNDPTLPCDGLFDTMDECVAACFSSDPGGF